MMMKKLPVRILQHLYLLSQLCRFLLIILPFHALMFRFKNDNTEDREHISDGNLLKLVNFAKHDIQFNAMAYQFFWKQ